MSGKQTQPEESIAVLAKQINESKAPSSLLAQSIQDLLDATARSVPRAEQHAMMRDFFVSLGAVLEAIKLGEVEFGGKRWRVDANGFVRRC